MVNNAMFEKLRSTPRKYKCKDHFYWNPEHMNHKFKGARTDPSDPDSPLAELVSCPAAPQPGELSALTLT